MRSAAAATPTMRGVAAQYLFRQVFPLQADATVVYHAVAGGVGLVARQWAGAGHGRDRRRQHRSQGRGGRAHGCAHVIVTGGQGGRTVYDTVGKDTQMTWLDGPQARGSRARERALSNNGYLSSRGQGWFTFAMTLALAISDCIDRQVIASLSPHLDKT